jgi:hypothetical protein
MAEQLKWIQDASGTLVMPARQREFLDWLLTAPAERQPPSQAKWAQAHMTSEETVRSWKRDPRFKEEWRRRADETVVSTERISALLDTLWQKGKEGDVQAATKYLDWAAKLLPPKGVADDESVKHLSDEELVEQLKHELNLG